MIKGSTCQKFVENLSKRTANYPNGKPHADVMVVECGICGARKRWAVGARRQGKGKKARAKAGGEVERVEDEVARKQCNKAIISA